jgi:hypothetical protein
VPRAQSEAFNEVGAVRPTVSITITIVHDRRPERTLPSLASNEASLIAQQASQWFVLWQEDRIRKDESHNASIRKGADKALHEKFECIELAGG